VLVVTQLARQNCATPKPISNADTKTCHCVLFPGTFSVPFHPTIKTLWRGLASRRTRAAAVATGNLTPWSAVSRTWTRRFAHVRCVWCGQPTSGVVGGLRGLSQSLVESLSCRSTTMTLWHDFLATCSSAFVPPTTKATTTTTTTTLLSSGCTAVHYRYRNGNTLHHKTNFPVDAHIQEIISLLTMCINYYT